MANPEHLERLREGVASWNDWLRRNRDIVPDLRGADLRGARLPNIDLALADLLGANLSSANLGHANLRNTNLQKAQLSGANLMKAVMNGARLTDAVLRDGKLANARIKGAASNSVDFQGADLSGANLSRSNLAEADFRNAGLNGADLTDARMPRANLDGADLSGAYLRSADLARAKLSNTKLTHACFNAANLFATDFTGAICWSTLFADVDLSETHGLDSTIHRGPSSLGLDTFFKSKGKIPQAFLRGAGIPDIFIQYAASLSGAAFEFYTCFISYSTQDEEFASRLHNDFQASGIRCWKWDHDARTGRSLWGEIDQAIRVSDKLVLIASESSLQSPAVNREIERALIQEDERFKRRVAGEQNADGDVLFPVRLDDFIFKGWNHERKVDVTKKVVADARGWDKDSALYRRVLDRLVRDLKKGGTSR